MTYQPASAGRFYAASRLPDDFYVRGIARNVVPTALAEKIVAGRASAAEVVGAVTRSTGSVGFFWGAGAEFWSVKRAMEHAESDSGGWVTKVWERQPDYRTDPETAGYGIAVVLVARAPVEDFTEDPMGNSYYGLRPEGVELDLVEVYVQYGEGWKVLPATGLRVTSMSRTASRYLVEVQFGARNPAARRDEQTGRMVAPALDVDAGRRYVWVEVPHTDEHGKMRPDWQMDAEATETAMAMVGNGGGPVFWVGDVDQDPEGRGRPEPVRQPNPIALTGDMPTKATIIKMIAMRAEAGPGSGRIPKALRAVTRPFGRALRSPRKVVLDRPALRDLQDVPTDLKDDVSEALHAVEDGKADLEAKERAPLIGTFTVRITQAWRAAFYLGVDAFWHCFWIGNHNYQEAERRFASLSTTAIQDHPTGLTFELVKHDQLWMVKAIIGGDVVGRLTWSHWGPGTTLAPGPNGRWVEQDNDSIESNGWIVNVEVDEAWRRKGIASAMLAEARRHDPRVRHNPERTSDGRAWSERVAAASSRIHRGVRIDLGERRFASLSTTGAFAADDYEANAGKPTSPAQTMTDAELAANPMGTTSTWYTTQAFGEDYKFRITYDPIRSPRQVTASFETANGKYYLVGYLIWDRAGVIDSVLVSESFQRMGVATAMLDWARKASGVHVQHSTTLTDKGRSWSEKAAARTEAWRPTGGMFAKGQDTLDPRVFDLATSQMRPQVRDSVLGALDGYWTPLYGDWRAWARVYLAGSGASYWWDSDADMDILIGVDLDALRRARPANREVADSEIVAHLNAGLKNDLRPTTTALNGFETTFFINEGAFDIRAIQPYAAYDMTADAWVVHPPVLDPSWSAADIEDSTWRRVDEVITEAEAVLALPEPARSQAGIALFDWVHEGRRMAYSPGGRGWLDPGNVIYQALTQHPDRLLRRLYLLKHPETDIAAPPKVASKTDLPPGYTIEVQEEQENRWGYPTLRLTVKHDRKAVAHLGVFQRLDPGDAFPSAHPNIWVDPEHQRKGLASAMYAEVHRRWPGVLVKHSPHASDDARSLNRTLKERFGPDLHLGFKARARLTAGFAGDWRKGLTPEQEGLLKTWEKGPQYLYGPQHRRFRTLLKDAPRSTGPLYRGDDVIDRDNYIVIDPAHPAFPKPGQSVTIKRPSSASTDPVIAAGFGHVLYVFEGEQAPLIQNSLAEAVIAPGTFRVTRVEDLGQQDSRAPIDGSTIFKSRQVRVHLRREGAQVTGANWMRAFSGSGENHYAYNDPYIEVQIDGPLGPPMSVPGSKVPVPWQGDVGACIEAATAKAKAHLAADDFLANLVRQKGPKAYLIAGSGETSRVIGSAKAADLPRWGAPVKAGYKDPWPGFLERTRRDRKGAWTQFCQEIADAQPPGFDTHPALAGQPEHKVTIYRGITLMPGQDPATATNTSRGGNGMGTSWTLDLNSAKAIAERGGAGFSGDNGGAKRVKKRAGAPSRYTPTEPVVIRAVVDLNAPGIALFTDGRMYYASEQEVNVDPGTEIQVTGYAKAQFVPESERAKAAAEEVAKDNPYDDGAYYWGTYRWGAFSGGGRRTAATKTLYRGVSLLVGQEDLETNRRRIDQYLMSLALAGHGQDTLGTSYQNAGVGQHWTTNRQVAVNFSDPMVRHAEEKKTRGTGYSEIRVPVVITATVAEADYVSDQAELEEAMVEGIGWNGIPSATRLPEDEVLVRDGAPVHVVSVEIAAPTTWGAVLNRLDNGEDDRIQGFKQTWRQIGGGMQAVAAYGPDLIARGLSLTDFDETFAKKVAAGTVTARDFLDVLGGDGLGVWWGVMGVFGDLSDFEDYAFSSGEEYLRKQIEDGYVGEDFVSGEIEVVLIAKRPQRGGQPWDPQVHNPIDPLMGNSYLEDGEPIEMVEIRYNAGWGWKSLRASGLRARAGLNGGLPEDLNLKQAEDRKVEAYAGPDLVGWLEWYEDGEIRWLHVSKEYRRRGVASAMWEEAKRIEPLVHHSEILSQSGAQWSKKVAARAGNLYGKGIKGMFPEDQPQTLVPWDAAARRIDEPLYDKEALRAATRDPAGHMREFDPRNLRANQSFVTRSGVAYYLSDEYARTGRTFADRDKPSNRIPLVYVRRDGQNVILTGHHRAAADLLAGRPFKAIAVEEPESVARVALRHPHAVRGGSPAGAFPHREREDGGRGGRGDPRRAGGGAGLVRAGGRGAGRAGSQPGDGRGPAALRSDRFGAAGYLSLYHGTRAENVERIRQQGLTPPSAVTPAGWFMLTTSREQAAAYSPGGVVLEYRIPTERIYGSDDYQRGGEPLLWPGQPHDVYGHAATAYAVNGPLPSEYLVGVHSGRTASGSTYYHGSPVLLEPGTVLRPAEESRFARQAEGRVFFTPDPWVAATHAKSPGRNDGATRVYDGRSWLYEVEPVGVVVDDPEAVAAGKAGQSLMAPSAKVVRRLEPEQAVALMMGRTATGDPVFGAVHAAKVLYHGTDASLVDQIRREGLTSPSYAETHNTLTESAHQARTLATKRHLNPVVLRFKVSPEQMDTHLWPAYEYWGHDDTANTYALRQPLPPEAFDGIEQGRTAASGSLPAGYVMEVHEGTRYGQPTVTVLVKHQDDPDTPVAALGLMRRANPLPKSEDPEVFEVNAVQVYPEHQRKGIATAMYDEVHKRYPGVPVLHSFGPGQSTDARALNKTLKQRYGPKMHLGRAQTSLTSTLAENLTERH